MPYSNHEIRFKTKKYANNKEKLIIITNMENSQNNNTKLQKKVIFKNFMFEIIILLENINNGNPKKIID